jgi:hypothetical protein
MKLVSRVLGEVLPPDVPPSHRRIVSAISSGSGRREVITAELEMIDGQPATVELRPWSLGWSHRFTNMPGGALSYEDGVWIRVADEAV